MWTIVRVCSAAPLVSFRLTPPLRKTRMGTQLAAGQAAPRTVCLYGLLACATLGRKPNNAKPAAGGTPIAIYEIGVVTTPQPAPDRHEL